jgi:glycine hydroxymethyltransferase
VTGGTDNHLILVDLRGKNLSCFEFETALHEAGISVNRNSIPNDPRPPKVTSGVRVGTAALTTRGIGAKEMQRIAELFNKVAENLEDKKILADVKEEVKNITNGFPVPGITE